MHHLSLRVSILNNLLISLLGLFCIAGAGQVRAQDKAEKVTIAVFDLQGVRTEPTTAIAASDRLREEVLKTGRFRLLGRNTLDKNLAEQGLNQLTCLEGDCALKVGKAMGARLVIIGKIVIVDSGAWQISAEIIDVAAGETVVADSIIYEGNLVGLISKGIPQLVNKIIPTGDPASYEDIVAFLQQRKTAPSIAAKSDASQREDKREAKKPPESAKEPFDRRYRIWGSPISVFSMDFRDIDAGDLETFEGSGASAGFEVQFLPTLAAGAAIHVGSLENRISPIDGSSVPQPISGDYQTINLLFMGTVPRARPWFYFGTGLGYTSVDWNDAGTTGSDSIFSTLIMLRLAYTFDSGLMLGWDFQGSFIGSSSGDRHNSLRGRGIKDPEAAAYASSLFIGYEF